MLTFSAWEKVDRMARLLGVADDDPRRRTAAVEACLYRRLDAKHTLTSVGTLGDAVMAALRCGKSTARGAIDHACRGHAIVAAAHGYQPVGAAVMEKTVASYLLAGVPGPQRNLFSGNLASIVAASIDGYRSRTGLQLNAAQRKAVEMAVHYPLSVLTGGAGTGKTTVLQVIHDIAEQIGVPRSANGPQRARGPTAARGYRAGSIHNRRVVVTAVSVTEVCPSRFIIPTLV
jgi:exodeoxyribonuclease V alpha subunit